MSDFKDRLRIETDQLIEKIAKLDAFIDSETFNKLDVHQKDLLVIQLNAMETYKMCLVFRFNSL